jgi:small subunit ribosomal protein S16
MPVKIRLQRHGKKGKPFFHIIAADARTKRDGRYIEKFGSYNPNTNPATIELDGDRALYWLQNGAVPSDTAKAIMSYRGVIYRNHLLKGVAKGAFDMAEADKRFDNWMAEKEAKVQAKRNKLSAAEEQQLVDTFKREREIQETRAKEIAAANSPMVEEVAKAAPEAAAETTEEVATEAVEATAELVEEATEKVAEVAEEVAEKTEEVVAEVAEEVAEKTEEVVAEVAEEVAEKTEEVVAEVTEEVAEVAEEVAEKVEEVAEEVADATSSDDAVEAKEGDDASEEEKSA